MIVGLCSTYREGKLAASAVRSLLPACNRVTVFDGPIGNAAPLGEATDWSRRAPTVNVVRGTWVTDADKRTAMLWDSRLHDRSGARKPMWGVILDGDELLVNGEYLPEYFEALPPGAMGFSLHLMELDGSCSLIPNRVLRLDLIERWTISSHTFVVNGVEVTKPNVKILAAGQPDTDEWQNFTGDGPRQRRRPLQGEPHILHRSVLRSPERQLLQRQHEAEAEQFSQLAGNTPDGSPTQQDGVRIWLPG